MGWQDAPVVKKSAWEEAPVVKPKAPPKKQERSLARDLWESTKNTVAGLGQGVTSIPDAATNALGAVMAEGVRYGGKGLAGVVDALGGDAKPIRQKTRQIVQDLYNPITIGGVIEKAAPTPQDTTGKGVRLASQFAGGMMTGGTVDKGLSSMFGVKLPPKPVLKPTVKPQNAAAEIIDEGKKAGVRVLTSDVKPPKTFIGKTTQAVGERIPFIGTGGTRAAQQTERVEAVKNVVREFGGEDAAQLFDTAPTAMDDVAKNLMKTRGAELTRLTTAKTRVIEGIDGTVPLPNTIKAIDDQIARLQSLNSKDVAPAIAKLEDFKTSLQGQKLTNVEEIRKIMGKAFDDPGLAGIKDIGQKAINAVYVPLRDDMGAFIRQAGGDEAFSAWKNANDKLAAMAGELDAGTFKSVLRNAEMTPENVGKLLFSKNPSDVARLYSNLDEVGKSRAQAAVLQRAYDKAISADSGLSVERFVNNLMSMGDSIGVVFKGDELARIKGLTKLLDATRRAASASAAPATGVQNTPIVGGFALGSLFGGAAIPVAGAGGLLARAYESPIVRNWLLKVAKARPGSPHEAKMIARATGAISVAIREQGAKIGTAMNENLPASLAASEGQTEQE